MPVRIRNPLSKAVVAALVCAAPVPADAAGQPADDAPTKVTFADGAVEGRVVAGVLSFKGIPYAAPPLGSLRWRPPQPVKPWTGVLDASAFEHDCMQRSSSVFALGTTEPSEDCLFLNVFRPSTAGSGPLPVLVYIHGGGFTQGGSSAIVYGGENLARQGLVTVTLNYRLGRLGFFAHPALESEHPDEPQGNYGYLDQIAALKWVQRNIAAFGGDPANVTIFGQSAGGASVSAMLISPLSEGLFQKAIVQSAPFRNVHTRRLKDGSADNPSLESLGLAFAHAKHIDGTDAQALARLRALPAADLMDLREGAPANAAGAFVWGGPAQDGKVIPMITSDPFTENTFKKVPIMVGATSDDRPVPPAKRDPYARFGAHRAEAERVYDPERSGNPHVVGEKGDLDTIMLEPARHIARSYTRNGTPIYEYRFSYLTQGLRDKWARGAPHGAELAYVFDNVPEYYGPVASVRDRDVARAVSAYWVNFAKRGDPNGPGLPEWPRYDPEKDMLLDVRPDGSAVAEPDPAKTRLDFVATVADGAR